MLFTVNIVGVKYRKYLEKVFATGFWQTKKKKKKKGFVLHTEFLYSSHSQ